jgi:hypothetical protein
MHEFRNTYAQQTKPCSYLPCSHYLHYLVALLVFISRHFTLAVKSSLLCKIYGKMSNSDDAYGSPTSSIEEESSFSIVSSLSSV